MSLHLPDDEELERLADLAARPEGVLPAEQEHLVSWLADQTPLQIRRELIATTRKHRDLDARSGWTLDLAVEVGDELVGMQSLAGFHRWPMVRNVGTSSWLVRDAQHRGIGTQARCAVLDLAFGRLKAAAAFSWSLPANAASTAVSARLGYHLVQPADPEDPASEAKYRLDAASWRRRRPEILQETHILGAESIAELLDD